MYLWKASTTSIALLAVGLLIGVCQWLSIVTAGKKVSLITLFGGTLGAVGCLLSPNPTVRMLWWLPPLIDPGCVLSLLYMAAFVVWKWWNNGRQ